MDNIVPSLYVVWLYFWMMDAWKGFKMKMAQV